MELYQNRQLFLQKSILLWLTSLHSILPISSHRDPSPWLAKELHFSGERICSVYGNHSDGSISEGLCLGPYGSPRGVGSFLRARYPCTPLKARQGAWNTPCVEIVLPPEHDSKWSAKLNPFPHQFMRTTKSRPLSLTIHRCLRKTVQLNDFRKFQILLSAMLPISPATPRGKSTGGC